MYISSQCFMLGSLDFYSNQPILTRCVCRRAAYFINKIDADSIIHRQWHTGHAHNVRFKELNIKSRTQKKTYRGFNLCTFVLCAAFDARRKLGQRTHFNSRFQDEEKILKNFKIFFSLLN